MLLFSGLFLAELFGLVFTKLNSRALFGKGKTGYAAYTFVTSVIAIAFFFAMAHGDIRLNGATFLYSCAYAAVCLVSLVLSIVILEYYSVAVKTIVMCTDTLALDLVSGFVLFSEKPLLKTFLKFGIMICVIILVFWGQRSKEQNAKACDTKSGIGKKAVGVILLTGLTVNGCLSGVITKYYALAENVCDNNSFFFFTNVVMGAVSLILFSVFSLRSKEKDRRTKICNKSILWTVLITVSSNVGSVFSIMLLKITDISLYSPIASAIGVITGVAVSLLFCEKVQKTSILAAILSVVAIIV